MSNNKMDDTEKILDNFHSNIFEIMRICKKIDPNNVDVIWLTQQISLARNVDPTLIINKAKDKLWNYRTEILKENTDFFLKNNFRKYIKNDDNEKFMFTLLCSIKKGYKKLTPREKKYIWGLVKNMLECCLKYKMIINDTFQ